MTNGTNGDKCANERAEVQRLENELRRLQGALQRAHTQDQRRTLEAQIREVLLDLHLSGMALYECLYTPPKPTSNLSVYDVERTQAIQFYFWGASQGSWSEVNPATGVQTIEKANSVPLVAKKDLILRVYIDGENAPDLPIPTSVTGKVQYAGHPDLAPINGPISPRRIGMIDRGNATHTLNFRVPAAHCTGTVNFTVTVFDPAHPGEAQYSSLPKSFPLDFRDVGAVRIFAAMINYTGKDARGKNVNLPNPPITKLVNILQQVAKVYPVTGFHFTGCTTIQYNDDVPKRTNGCGTPWDDLFDQLGQMSLASSEKAIYLGVFPTGVPGGSASGCGGTLGSGDSYAGVAIGFENDDGSTFAQEMGHALFRAHAPCGNPPSVDVSYPTYDSYPGGSIGEYGFDSVTSKVFNPSSTYDFMSYCPPNMWVSPYTYISLMNAVSGSPFRRLLHRRVVPFNREQLLLMFRLHRRDDKVELLPSFHLPIPDPGRGVSPESPITCDLLDEEGRILESGPCHLPQPQMKPHAPYQDFHVILPWHQSVHSIAIYRNGHQLHAEEIERESPTLHIRECKFVERGKELVRVEWHGEHTPERFREQPYKPIQYLVRYSHDDGETWQALAANLTEPHYVANLEMLPGGDHCAFQVVAYAGVRTAVTQTEPFPVSRKPQQAYIFSPEAGATFRKGEPVVLLGGGFSPDFQTTEFEDMVWTSNLDGVIGVGHQVISSSLSAGRHKITLDFPDGLGGEAAARVFISVSEEPRHRDRDEAQEDGVQR